MRRLLFAATLLIPIAAESQAISVYGTFSPVHASNVETGINASNQEQFTSYWSNGFGGGVTLGLIPIGPIRLGFDFRGSTKSGLNGADTALAGLKFGIKVPLISLKPYVQASAGYLATRTANVSSGATPNTTFGNQYLAYEILGGLDYPLVHFVDLRLIEIGAGQGVNVFAFGSTANATIFTVNTGIVVHF